MKALIALLIIAAFGWLIVDGVSSWQTKVQQAESVEAIKHPPKGRTPSAKILCGETTIEIHNTGAEDWHDIDLYLNGDPPHAHHAVIDLKAGAKGIYRLRDFTVRNGERFNPFSHKPQTLWIGGAGYDLEKYAL